MDKENKKNLREKIMRKTYESQYSFGDVDIRKVETNPKSRDEIDKATEGLKFIYTTEEIKKEVFSILEKEILPNVSKKTGRRGMDLWKILVLGVMKQTCSCDYDHLHHLANNNLMIRELLGHPRAEWGAYKYEYQTIVDNITLLRPEVIDKVNEIVVNTGHKLLGGKKKEELRASVDSFVVKTDIHFPSDISLLNDSIRKSISLTKQLSEQLGKSGWRQSSYLIKSFKTDLRKVQKVKHSGKSATDEKKKVVHKELIERACKLFDKVKSSLSEIRVDAMFNLAYEMMAEEIEIYIGYGEKQIELITRRVLNEEEIPHSEKIFSIFEPYTRWISKGKAGVLVEFGLPVSIIRDQQGFILDYEIMEQSNDVDVAVPLTTRAKEKFPVIKSCSYDKGPWSPSNRKIIGEIVEIPVMPKKGRPNKAEQAEESSETFKKLRRQHSAVESSINGLDHTGLDKCYDHGIAGFKRCVALSILSRNIHTLGKLIREKQEKQKKRKRYKKAA